MTALDAGGVDIKIGGGSQAPLWYFLVVGIQAMTLTFPFSRAMRLTRREFCLGSLAAAAVSGLRMSLTFVLLAIGLVLVGLIALVSLRQGWPEVGAWILDTGSPCLRMWAVLACTLLATGSYLTLRRMPA